MQAAEAPRAFKRVVWHAAPDDISEFLQENSLAFCRFFARMVVNSRRIRDFLRCCDLLSERVF